MQNGAFAVIREGLMWCAIFAAALLSFFYSGDIMRLVTNEAAVAGVESPDEGAATSPSAADSASFDRIAHLEAGGLLLTRDLRQARILRRWARFLGDGQLVARLPFDLQIR